MTSPLPLPDWVPWWVHLAILLAALVVALMIVAMPFSVWGTKARLESIELRLDEIQAEIRGLALRLPEADLDGDDDPSPRSRYTGPPIPPAPTPARRDPRSPSRTEPRLFR